MNGVEYLLSIAGMFNSSDHEKESFDEEMRLFELIKDVISADIQVIYSPNDMSASSYLDNQFLRYHYGYTVMIARDRHLIDLKDTGDRFEVVLKFDYENS